ncbi:hypothetical protein G7077_05010 [Sphingomonas piscis]|uniref:Uncharacterized protein n=1 Tax=Sphingomonas piscis TaxID=2714943 RepID=A0A6G7YNN9_9SPHN|nr:hypothetical protein [Sphingomonas piscis]QIK78358.1 hypothetical protein G7077_05010 [Sphingomonas piscis]
MRKQMIENAAFEIATQCRTVEDSIDAALTELSELQDRILRMSAIPTVGFATAQEPVTKLAGAVQALVSARGSMADCHAALAQARGKVPGLRTVAFGDNECPPPKGQVDLRIVA